MRASRVLVGARAVLNWSSVGGGCAASGHGLTGSPPLAGSHGGGRRPRHADRPPVWGAVVIPRGRGIRGRAPAGAARRGLEQHLRGRPDTRGGGGAAVLEVVAARGAAAPELARARGRRAGRRPAFAFLFAFSSVHNTCRAARATTETSTRRAPPRGQTIVANPLLKASMRRAGHAARPRRSAVGRVASCWRGWARLHHPNDPGAAPLSQSLSAAPCVR